MNINNSYGSHNSLNNNIKNPKSNNNNNNNESNSSKVLSGVLRITIIDRGVGISSENQQRLFGEIIQFNPEKLQAGGTPPDSNPNPSWMMYILTIQSHLFCFIHYGMYLFLQVTTSF